jgi:chemotaxis protein MotB
MKKRRPEHSNHERWLVSYADFITLLFALFVVLYASSQVDKRKAGRLAEAIQAAFQQLGVFQGTGSAVAPFGKNGTAIEKLELADQSQILSSEKDMLTSSEGALSLQDTRQLIEKALAPEIQRNEVSMSLRREGLVVSLKEIGFFDSGSASIRPASFDAIGRLVEVLRQRPEDLRVEGHTDDVPIHNARFSSNWELSTSRATGLINLLITRFALSPERLSAAGYGQFHPVASNDTAAGRGQNRRLDVVILAARQTER